VKVKPITHYYFLCNRSLIHPHTTTSPSHLVHIEDQGRLVVS
jgi:hypothetical protein